MKRTGEIQQIGELNERKIMEEIKIIDTNANNILEYGVCGYKDIKRPGYPEKIEWLKDRFREGLKVKTLYSVKDGTQGMLEYKHKYYEYFML